MKSALCSKYGYVADRWINKNNVPVNENNTLFPIWVCWWQGEENMPDLVTTCYRSLLKNSNGHPVILITKDNYKDYVSFPEHIMEKFEKGCISITHLSDILRASLIYEHGGLWIDSTILVTGLIPESFDLEIFSIKHKKKGEHVSGYKWTAFLLFGQRKNVLHGFMQDFFYEYWLHEDKLIEYLMIDYAIAIAYDRIPEVTKMIDKVPYNNLRHNDLRNLMKKAYDVEIYNTVIANTFLHKLTWKKKFQEKTKQGLPTFYAHILKT